MPGCDSACPSGARYGHMVDDARAQIESQVRRGWLVERLRRFAFVNLLESRVALTVAGTLFWFYEASGLKRLARGLAD